jgi:hypothetical protein
MRDSPVGIDGQAGKREWIGLGALSLRRCLRHRPSTRIDRVSRRTEGFS